MFDFFAKTLTPEQVEYELELKRKQQNNIIPPTEVIKPELKDIKPEQQQINQPSIVMEKKKRFVPHCGAKHYLISRKLAREIVAPIQISKKTYPRLENRLRNILLEAKERAILDKKKVIHDRHV